MSSVTESEGMDYPYTCFIAQISFLQKQIFYFLNQFISIYFFNFVMVFVTSVWTLRYAALFHERETWRHIRAQVAPRPHYGQEPQGNLELHQKGDKRKR